MRAQLLAPPTRQPHRRRRARARCVQQRCGRIVRHVGGVELDLGLVVHDDGGGARRPRSPAVLAPLTGLPIDPATGVAPGARREDRQLPTTPARRSGIDQADVVYEEIVEGITRFVAVFQSERRRPGRPDPLRRAPSDVDIARQLGRPLFAWSGGNPFVTRAIGSANIDNLTPDRHESAYFRTTGSREAPHNLLLQHVDAVLRSRPTRRRRRRRCSSTAHQVTRCRRPRSRVAA